jgi:hypothetical protein
MTPEEEIERFFASYHEGARTRVEGRWQYKYALKHGKITTALEIAAVMLSDYWDRKEEQRNITRIFKKEFPEVENPN